MDLLHPPAHHMGHGCVDTVYPVSLGTSVEEFGLSSTNPLAIEETYHTLLDAR